MSNILVDNKIKSHTCYRDQATLTDINHMISGDGLSICRLGISDKGADSTPCCQDVSSSHWWESITRNRGFTQKYTCECVL